jgi:hypothetical protein
LEAGAATYRIHDAVDITTGAEKVSSMARVIPIYDKFQASRQLQRPALTLSNGIIYVAFGSHVDYDRWGGYLFGYSAVT